ncbi:hypothetical protein LSH36_307g01001 [Paralvinella palmiformis]|uniref:Nose resistant-to-fluoxetine protein N-terminal domain-containing protein n=1 Tax=Paralvinella palmiformis TaxID=53620 RepID=A0AAD9JH73_9ANNE|nr:hypothetical protein LSH36_307g01001 [Paralvinella palmiformis]
MLIPLYTLLFLSAASLVVRCDEQDIKAFYYQQIAAKWSPKVQPFITQIETIGEDKLGLSLNCQIDFLRLLNEVTNPNITDWALLMIDSWGVVESGTFSGNTNWEGRMTQCRQIHSGVKGNDGKEIEGKYCHLGWPLFGTWQLPAGIGTCVPQSCPEDNIFEIIQALAFGQVIDVSQPFPWNKKNVTLPHCAEIPDIKNDKGAIAAITILYFFGLLVLFGSMYDIVTNRSRSESAPAQSTGHNDVTFGKQNEPANDDQNQRSVELITLSLKSDVIPDNGQPNEPSGREIIFTNQDDGEAGTSTNKETLTKQKNGELSICARIILSFSAYRNMQNVATYRHTRGSYRCLNAIRFMSMCWIVLGHSWELGLFLTERPTTENVGDLVNRFKKRFSSEVINKMDVAVESFFLISAMLTTISFLKKVKKHNGKPPCAMFGFYYFHRFWRVPIAGIVFTSLGLCGSIIASAYLSHGVFIRNDTNYFTDIYIAPWTRSGSYFVGIILGYILYKSSSKPKMNKIGVVFGWLISVLGIFAAVYLNHYIEVWPVSAKIIYMSTHRVILAAAVGWIVFACSTGYGGIINSVLSWVGWVPLAKLTYTGYLIHPIFVYYGYYSSPVEVYFSVWIMIYYFLGTLTLTLGASFVVTSFLELPFTHLEKIMFRNVKI